jgi:hypothetical protein
VLPQECFSAGYASFNLEPVQYSTSAAAAYPEANKYDPKGVDKYGHEGMPAKVRPQPGDGRGGWWKQVAAAGGHQAQRGT